MHSVVRKVASFSAKTYGSRAFLELFSRYVFFYRTLDFPISNSKTGRADIFILPGTSMPSFTLLLLFVYILKMHWFALYFPRLWGDVALSSLPQDGSDGLFFGLSQLRPITNSGRNGASTEQNHVPLCSEVLEQSIAWYAGMAWMKSLRPRRNGHGHSVALPNRFSIVRAGQS